MKLNPKKRLVAKSGKVKSVDFHPTFSWILLGLYNGSLSIYDYNTNASVQYLEVTLYPIRAAKFLADKNFIICGADDKMIRVYNYNTMEKVKEFEAHSDFIRSIAVHYKEPLFVTSSDDSSIHLYNAKNFNLIRTYDEHKDFVMKLAVNPKDYNMFASCSMDKKIKIWSFTANNSQITLEGHVKGVGSIAFCPLNDKPYLASGGDDFLVKVWDYTNKNCVFTYQGHEHNITSLCFHPELPILISSAEDQVCKFWNINTNTLEDSKIFGYDIVWDITAQKDSNMIGMGCDEATVVFQLGSDQPLATFSQGQSKIIYSQQNNLYSINLKQIQGESKDGKKINILPKQLGTSDVYPSIISYSPNGRYFSIISDKEFIISTSGVYRSSCVGTCHDLSWNEGDSFVTKEGSTVKIYQELKETKSFRPGYAFDKIFGGPLFGVRTEDAVYFYDCDNTILIRKIDVEANKVVWNENRTRVAIICDDSTFILKVNFKSIEEYIDSVVEGTVKADEEGCEDSFEGYYDISERVVNGFFIEEVFVYQNEKNKINYSLSEKNFTITTLNGKFFLLGYLQATERLYLINKNFELISYNFPFSFVNYQIAIINKDFDKAEKILPNIPEHYNEKIISFLEKFNLTELSYKISKNQNQKFSLALKLKKLNDAWEIAKKENNKEKMKLVADLALELGEFSFAENAMISGDDYSGLLLYYSSIQDKEKLKQLAIKAKEHGIFNISFSSFFQLNDIENCVSLLIESKMYAEASLFCRTYCPSKLEAVISKWNEKIEKEEENNRMSIKIVNPFNNSNKSHLETSEKINQEFYNKVNEGSIDDMAQFMKFFTHDTYKDIINNPQTTLDDIMK